MTILVWENRRCIKLEDCGIHKKVVSTDSRARCSYCLDEPGAGPRAAASREEHVVEQEVSDLSVCTWRMGLWYKPTLQQFLKNCGKPPLDLFGRDSIPWDESHDGAGDESKDEGIAELKCYELTAVSIPCSLAPLEGGRIDGWWRKVFQIALSPHCSNL